MEQPEFCEFYCDVDGLGSVEKNRTIVLVYYRRSFVLQAQRDNGDY